MSEPRALLIYSQPTPSTSAFILGDRDSLTKLRDTISAALRDAEGASMTLFPERGREEHPVVIGVISRQEIADLQPPYSSPIFATHRGLDPAEVASVASLFPPER